MSTLGIVLAWGAVQVTLFSVVGAVIYALARRRGPAAGSLAALASLLIVLAVTLLVFSPWPRWYSAGTEHAEIAANGSATIPAVEIDPEVTASTTQADAVNTLESSDRPNASRDKPEQMATDNDARAAAAAFWQTLMVELRTAPAATEQPARHWPGYVAAALAVGVLLGAGRLTLGLLAVRRLRATSLPITDDSLLTHVDRLREQLGCQTAVEVRESLAVSTPATIGWRRPLVILPLNWRTWSDQEQDAVLAHEIAHVCRADYAAAILAQMCLAVHFYHPLVHWLARRLRLEQELAADALGARVAGGREQYLRSLAALALAQDNRRLAWAARPFLPESGTLLRRIEMLRDRKLHLQASLSRVWRVGLVAILVAAGVGIAGVRGPKESGSNLALAAPPEEKQAQDEAQAKFSLDYVPANATFVLAIRPAELARNDYLKPLLPLANEMLRMKARYGVSFEQMEAVYLVAYKQAVVGGQPPFGQPPLVLLVIFRSIDSFEENKQRDLSGLGLVPGPQGIWQERDATEASQGFFLADKRTLVAGSVGALRELAAGDVKQHTLPGWAEQWKAVASNPVAIALDVKSIRGDVERQLSPRPGEAPWINLAAPIWEQTEIVVAGATLGDKVSVHATATCASSEGAHKVLETSKALVTIALNMLDSMRAESTAAPPRTAAAALSTIKPLLDLGEKGLKSVQFSQSGVTLEVHAEVSFDAAKALAAALPSVEAARDAARRTQSMNNMKQIALALHKYHDKNGEFPPAIVIGPDGKTPHSWRVEILPYLEQSSAGPLYEQYKFDEPWDSENNRKVIAKMPAVFRDANDDAKSTNASYFALTGDSAAFSGKDGNKAQSFRDGLSNTIMVVEAKRDVPWTKPEDIAYDPAKPLPALGGHHKEGFLAGFADGSVRLIAKSVDEKVLRALFTKAGGEVVNVPN